jgi:hypothetical protein
MPDGLSVTTAIEFVVGARMEVEVIPDPATLSNVLVCLAAAEGRGGPGAAGFACGWQLATRI